MQTRIDTTDLLRGTKLIDLAERDGISLRGNREKAGPCPKCGGDDRFHTHSHGGRDYFFCRKCHPKWGDAIEYLRWTRGLSFKDAVAALGGGRALPADSLPKPAVADKHELPPCPAWQEKARLFSDWAATRLWSPAGATALAYLRGRGLSDETIRKFRLGYNLEWLSRPGAGWGLDGEVKLAPGIVIPRKVCGEMWAVNVRRLNPDGTPYSGENKYLCVTGSRLALFNAEALTNARTAMVFGGEFDAMLAQQFAPDGVACVTFGGETRKPSVRWLIALWDIKQVHICTDADAAGNSGAANWIEALGDRAQRAIVPQGKDLTEFWQAGGDVPAWIAGVSSRKTASGGQNLSAACALPGQNGGVRG